LGKSIIGRRKAKEGQKIKGKQISSKEEWDIAATMRLLASIELHV